MASPHETPDLLTTTAVVLRYESLRDQGEDVTPETLCDELGCPHLLDDVKQQIRDLESIKYFLQTTTADYRGFAGKGAEPDPPVLPKIDNYEVLQTVGRGGFGVVWRAYDPELDRHVAIKVPRLNRPLKEGEINQFVKEARKAAALDHPNIVRIHHVHRRGSTFFIISEFIDGKNLREQNAERKFSPEESARLVAQVADALHHAHLRGFVHRDVKPGNILLNRDQKPYLADFGLAVTEEEQLREKAALMGTVAYMSPEQAEKGNRRVDARTDIYSLGVVFYELLTGRLPFIGRTNEEYLEQICHRDPRPPRTLNDTLPRELERICLKCLAKKVADRYTTAADLAHDLRAWLDQQATSTVAPKPALPQQPAPGWYPRFALAGVGVLVLGVALLLYFRPWDDSTPVPPEPPEKKTAPVAVKPGPGAWHDLLEQKPVALIHPKMVFVQQFDPAKKQFWWDTQGDCLFRLGTASLPDYQVEITLEQSRLSGHRGLFLGCQPVQDETKKNYFECQAILLWPNKPPAGGAMIGRAQVLFNDKLNRVKGMQFLGPTISLPGLSSSRIILTAHVKKGNLSWVGVNQEEIRGLQLDQLPGRPNPLTGDFGIFADQDNCRLTTASWKFESENP